MLRICKYCGREYEGAPHSSACPDCVRQRKSSTIRPRTCRQCGAQFPGGPRAWYCPQCRRERKLAQARARQKNGPARPLGSIDRCIVCGGEYVVVNGLQKYCPKCAPEATRAIDREQARQWNRENTTPDQRREERKAAAAAIPCAVCGKPFVPTDSSITCSRECSAELARRNAAAYERAHRESRNRDQVDRRSAKAAGMSLQAYRDAAKQCVICGKRFLGRSNRVVCSPACLRVLKNRETSEWQKRNADRQYYYQKAYNEAKKAGLSPEQTREHIAQALERYQQNKDQVPPRQRGPSRRKLPPIAVGDKFTRWTVISLDARPRYVLCRCDCGTVREVFRQSLKKGESKSCGCYLIDLDKSRAGVPRTQHAPRKPRAKAPNAEGESTPKKSRKPIRPGKPIGVCKRGDRYGAYICIGTKQYWLGYFQAEADAIAARARAEKTLEALRASGNCRPEIIKEELRHIQND